MQLNDYQKFIAASRYARWNYKTAQRETWEETVERYFDFFKHHLKTHFKLTKPMLKKLAACQEAVLALEVMPSMRCMMTAGLALERDHVAGYNCSYVAVDKPTVFDEILYILMCGTGVGFSVERQYIETLPDVPDHLYSSATEIVVDDSKLGWASAYRELISLLYAGKVPKWNLSSIRPAGARLKTFGGIASGPDPLIRLFEFTVETFNRTCGRKLSSLQCHDIICSVADIVVVGGVRRSALISLTDVDDDLMRRAKSGLWYETHPYRALANISAVYNGKPDIGVFMDEWRALHASQAGERGIFNRAAAKAQVLRNGRRDGNFNFGTNPCSEILLRNKQFCNLSEVVVRISDTLKQLLAKVELAAILGSIQSTLTKFRFLGPKWKNNTEEERLLGVSLTGIMDNPLTINPEVADLNALRQKAIDTNKEWAELLGIPQSTAVTCVKPSGTVSQLVNSASGIHPRYAEHYIRTVRQDMKNPVTQFLKSEGVPFEPDVTKPQNTAVFSFPFKSPTNMTREKFDWYRQLNLWTTYNESWCEHKPSITVYVKEDEWLEVGAFVLKNFGVMSGVSFLPHTNHIYKQAPYQEITKEQYEAAVAVMPKIDWNKLKSFETDDTTIVTGELACSSGVCEVI